jgi:hypothetical protein
LLTAQAQNQTCNAWLAQNGTNIASTTSDLTLQGGASQPQLLNQSWIVYANVNDYVQIYWSCASTSVSLTAQAAAIPAPAFAPLTNPSASCLAESRVSFLMKLSSSIGRHT